MKVSVKNVLSLILLLLWPAAALGSSVYSGGNYTQCAYSEGCPTPSPTVIDRGGGVIEVIGPAGSTNDTTGGGVIIHDNSIYIPCTCKEEPATAMPINLSNGQTVSTGTYLIQVDPVANHHKVQWVEIWIDGVYIGKCYQRQTDGKFELPWDTIKDPGTKITIVDHLDDGNVAIKDIKIKLAANRLKGVTASSPTPPIAAALAGFLQKLHIPVEEAINFPYLIILLLMMISARMYQLARREARYLKELKAAAEREKLLTDEKDNFVMLAAHYLRTPLTLLKGGLEVMQLTAKETVSAGLKSGIEHLDRQINQLLNETEHSQKLTSIKPEETAVPGVVRSPLFWLPLLIAALLMAVSGVLAYSFARTDGGFTRFVFTLVIFALVAFSLYAGMRTYRGRKRLAAAQRTLLQQQRDLDAAKSKVIGTVVGACRPDLETIGAALGSMTDQAKAGPLRAGYDRLMDVFAKFEMLSQLRAGQLEAGKQKFDLDEAVKEAVQAQTPAAEAKKIQIKTQAKPTMINKNRPLLLYALDAVVNNAVKFSPAETEVDVRADQGEITVTDHGSGIPADRQAMLFKPFSRTTSALEFNEEGIGLSLYLSRIIMRYIGGDINLESGPGGTSVLVKL